MIPSPLLVTTRPLTNEKRVLSILTNQRPALPDHRCAPLVVGLWLGVALDALVSLNEEADLGEEACTWRRRRLPEKDIDRISEVDAHDVLFASRVRAAVTVSTVHETI